MSMKAHITLNLEFAGVIFPVQEHNGRGYVPLKPISDVFGLRWRQQMTKVTSDENHEIYETCTLASGGAGQLRDYLCIPIENVFGYFFSINPAQVRAHGNEKGAAFIIAKRKEWQKVLLDYEMATGGMIKSSGGDVRLKKMGMLINVSRTMHQKGSDPYLKAVQQELGSDLGFDIPVQQEFNTGT